MRPENLLDRTLKVRKETGALNVRDSPLGEVVGGLSPGTRVHLVEVKDFAGLGYMWARVERKSSRR
jgi:hypothetical protein